MPLAEIPADIRAFILKYVDSVAYMEALILLRHAPDVGWNKDSLATRLYITVAEAENILTKLSLHGVAVQNSDRYYFRCNSAELETITERVTRTYKMALVPVTNLIHSKLSGRIQEFADAFKLKQGK